MKQTELIFDKEIKRMLFLNDLKDKFLSITGWSSLFIFGITVMLLALKVASRI